MSLNKGKEKGKILNRKLLLGIALMLTMTATLAVLPARAWVGPPYTGPGDGPIPTEDYMWEAFGPRVDYTLIKFYGTDVLEWEALRKGDLDITDWVMPRAIYDDFMAGDDPGVAVGDYGGELGLWVLDVRNDPYINTNQNDFIGDAGDALNPFGDPTIIVWPGDAELVAGASVTRGSQARRALAHLLDRAAIIALTGAMHNAMWTHMSETPTFRLGGWINDAAMKYSFDPEFAADILDMAGYVDTDGDGVRNYDSNGDGSIAPGDANFVAQFWTRLDVFRSTVGQWIQERLSFDAAPAAPYNLANYGPRITVDRKPCTGGVAWLNVMLNKIGHLYTAGWSVSREPTIHFGIYHSAQYWHPGDPPNYMHLNDPELDALSELAAYAPSIEDARVGVLGVQERMNDPDFVGSIPVGNTIGRKAYWKRNVDTGTYWSGFINSAGYGINYATGSINTLLNAHPAGQETGGTLRYGWKYMDMPTSLNPFQYSWVWDSWVIFEMYDSAINVNPYDPFGGGPGLYPAGDLPWQSYDWEMDVLGGDGPGGAGSKFTFYLRDDIYFHDGSKKTAEDCYYGLQFGHWQAINHPEYGWTALPPWFWSSIMDITPEFDPVTGVVTDVPGVGVDMPDGPLGYKVVVNYNIESIWAFWWCAGLPVVPKEKWWDTFVPDPTGSDGFAPDPQMIGTGPFQVYPGSMDPPDLVHYDPSIGFIRMDKNPTFFSRWRPEAEKISITMSPARYITLGSTFGSDITVDVSITYASGFTARWRATIPAGGSKKISMQLTGVGSGTDVPVTVFLSPYGIVGSGTVTGTAMGDMDSWSAGSVGIGTADDLDKLSLAWDTQYPNRLNNPRNPVDPFDDTKWDPNADSRIDVDNEINAGDLDKLTLIWG